MALTSWISVFQAKTLGEKEVELVDLGKVCSRKKPSLQRNGETEHNQVEPISFQDVRRNFDDIDEEQSDEATSSSSEDNSSEDNANIFAQNNLKGIDIIG